MRWLWLVALGACGRVDFDPRGGSYAAGSDGAVPMIDAGLTAVCPIGTTAPDPITITGKAIHATNLGGVPNVAVEAQTSLGGAPIATATSDSTGKFTLSVPTGGVPHAFYFRLRDTADGYLDSVSIPAQATDKDATGLAGFLGTPSDMQNGIYNPKNLTVDPAAGSIFVRVTDCAGNGIGGATISVTGAAAILYSGPLDLPNATATKTGPLGYAWALNVPAGTVQLAAAASGKTFVAHPVEILPNSTSFMGTVITAAP